MTVHELEALSLLETTATNDKDDEYNIPLDISDIITICQEFNKLGWQIQQQIENILEVGVEESIKTGYVKREALPLIKNFLQQITKNAYFGDATDQARECIFLIEKYQKVNIIHTVMN